MPPLRKLPPGTSAAVRWVLLALAVLPPVARACTPEPCGAPPPRELPPRNWIAPIAETIGSNVLLFVYNRWIVDEPFAHITAHTVWRNLKGGWTLDTDDFNTNEVLHPYHGSVYFTSARSSGFGFWGSAGFAFGGSLIWKIAGENGPPSINDQVTTTVAGTVLGEALFRLSRLVLDYRHGPGPVRWTAAALIAPFATLNAAVLGSSIQDPDPPVPPYSGWFAIGAGGATASTRIGRIRTPEGTLGFDITYGLPESVVLERPFDHFAMSLDFTTNGRAPSVHVEDPNGPTWLLSIRGLVAGGAAPTEPGGRVLYGLFGTFDFGGPVTLRTTESGAGPGVVLALRPAPGLALEATALGSLTFGSAGGYSPKVGDRDYHFGIGGYLLGDVRATIADRVMLRATARTFLVPQAFASGSEILLVSTAQAMLRLGGPHAILLDGLFSVRQVRYPGSVYDEHLARAALSYAYVFGGGRQ